MDPKMQTALGVGGGMLAGAALEHEVSEFTHHHHHLGPMGALLGAGALGSALGGMFGKKNNAQPVQSPQSSVAPVPTPPAVPAAPTPGYSAPPPGGAPSTAKPNHLANVAMGGLAGVAGAAAIEGVSNMVHHHHHEGGVPPPGATNLGQFMGGSSYKGPPLYIHAAAFGDKDVTHQVRSMVDEQQQFVIKMGESKTTFGDPWP